MSSYSPQQRTYIYLLHSTLILLLLLFRARFVNQRKTALLSMPENRYGKLYLIYILLQLLLLLLLFRQYTECFLLF